MLSRQSASAYLAPMVVFGVFGLAEEFLPPALYPIAYGIKLAAVTATLLAVAPLFEIRPSWTVIVPSAAVGLAVFVAWIGIDTAVSYPHLGSRVAFDPMQIHAGAGRAAFLAVRLLGLVVVVPVMEELCWRSFVLRYVTNDADFRSVPIGSFTLAAFGVMVALSAAAHPEWLVAAIASVVYGLWVRHTRSLFAVGIAHATTNAALGAYVLITHDWKFW